MSISKIVTGVAVVTALFTTACNSGNVEGTYKLDKAEVKKSMEAELAKMPADQKEMGKLGLALIDAMEIELTLAADGKAKMKTSMAGLGALGGDDKAGKPEEKSGTWKKDGDKVVIDIDGKPSKCTPTGSALKCDPEKAGDPALTFKK